MPKTTNKLRNADFAGELERGSPRHWVRRAHGSTVRLRRPDDPRTGLTLLSDRATGGAYWSQTVTCRPGVFYRFSVEAACSLESGSDEGGFVLGVESLTGKRTCGEARQTPPVLRTGSTASFHEVFQIPVGVRSLRVSFGISLAKGSVDVVRASLVSIGEPDQESHPLAIPPPKVSQPPPTVVGSVCLCGQGAADRAVTALLATYLGPEHVSAIEPTSLDPRKLRCDALLLPDAAPPTAIRSLDLLLETARVRIVVISLSAFAALARGRVQVRCTEQTDDVPHARVIESNFSTSGFALHDVFPFASQGRRPNLYAQSQFRKTPELASMMKRHGFKTLLESVCVADARSEQPVALFRPTNGGGLFVLDLEPIERPAAPIGEPATAVQLLLSMLGHSPVGLGQFTVPVRKRADLCDLIRETGNRFEPFVVHDDDVPSARVTRQRVIVGAEDRAFGLPLQPKPWIVVRTGLRTADAEAVYGAYLWFKNLVRPPPFVCPYASSLASRFRLAWIPGVNAWEVGQTSRGSEDVPPADDRTAAMIEIVSRSVNRVRMVFAREDETYDRAAVWLPILFRTFVPNEYFLPGVADGERLSDRTTRAWRTVRYEPQIVVEREGFDDRTLRHSTHDDGCAVRIEVPGCDTDFVSHSIARTELAATLLEHVVGMVYGLTAVNRTTSAVVMDGLAPVSPGGAIILDRTDRALALGFAKTG